MKKLKVIGLALLMFTMVASVAFADTMVMAYASAGKNAQSQNLAGQNKTGRIQINASGKASGFYTVACQDGTRDVRGYIEVPASGGTVSHDFYMSSSCEYSVAVYSEGAFPAVGRLYDYIP